MIQKLCRLVLLAALPLLACAETGGPVLVFGGTSGVGLETVKLLRENDRPVTVFVRPTSNLEGLQPLGVDYVTGDALEKADVENAFAAGKFVAVISSLGGRRGEPRPDYLGNRNITEAAKAAGVRRVIQISSVGAGNTREPPLDDAGFMANVLYHKTLGEDHLIASGLDYTIIRPGRLYDEPATGNGVLIEEVAPGGINRPDVALLIIAVLDDDAHIGKVYHAIDRDRPGVPLP